MLNKLKASLYKKHIAKGVFLPNRESCGKYFNDLTRTIFEHHKFPIDEMFYILKER